MTILPEDLLIDAKGLLVDLHGFTGIPDTLCGETTVGDFLKHAQIGWDEATSSYYIVGPENEDGEPYYWIGNTPQIPSPYALVAIINCLFGNETCEFEGVFSGEALSALAEARNSTTEYPDDFLSIDEFWSEHSNTRVDLFKINHGCA